MWNIHGIFHPFYRLKCEEEGQDEMIDLGQLICWNLHGRGFPGGIIDDELKGLLGRCRWERVHVVWKLFDDLFTKSFSKMVR